MFWAETAPAKSRAIQINEKRFILIIVLNFMLFILQQLFFCKKSTKATQKQYLQGKKHNE
jgi:hypothetical protein